MTNESIEVAVSAFCEEDGVWIQFGAKTADFRQSPKAEAMYGPVGLWDVSEVTSMDSLIFHCTNFNEDISAWDVWRAESLVFMFAGATSFNQPLGAWDVRRVVDFRSMVCVPGGAPGLCTCSPANRSSTLSNLSPPRRFSV